MGIGKTLKGLLGNLAPTIGAAVGGPMGGVAMKFLADKFTGGDTGKVEDFLLAASPDQLKELKLAEIEFEREMRELDIDFERLQAQDRDSARSLAKSTTLWPQIVLATLYTTAYISTLWAFLTGSVEIDENYSEMVVSLIGALGAVQVQVLNFFFGSSSGSKEKTIALSKDDA